MNLFNEKIVKKNYDIRDALFVIGITLAAFLVFFIALYLNLTMAMPIIIIGIGYGVFRLISARHIEYEYSVMNGDIDIDKIVAKRRRVRIFSAESKDLEIVAPVKSEKYTGEYKSLPGRIEAVSHMSAEGIYFLAASYKGMRTIVFFEPNERMLQDFKKRIPRNVYLS